MDWLTNCFLETEGIGPPQLYWSYIYFTYKRRVHISETALKRDSSKFHKINKSPSHSFICFHVFLIWHASVTWNFELNWMFFKILKWFIFYLLGPIFHTLPVSEFFFLFIRMHEFKHIFVSTQIGGKVMLAREFHYF